MDAIISGTAALVTTSSKYSYSVFWVMAERLALRRVMQDGDE